MERRVMEIEGKTYDGFVVSHETNYNDDFSTVTWQDDIYVLLTKEGLYKIKDMAVLECVDDNEDETWNRSYNVQLIADMYDLTNDIKELLK